MLHGKKVVVVLPAYHAEKTLLMTYNDIPFDVVDDVVLVDDCSSDDTVAEGRRLGIKHIVVHEKNTGYGGNQKSCYAKALSLGADIVVMVHPDYQYAPKLITAMASMIASGEYDAVLGSRILGTGALKGGMPLYKYVANRFLTLTENLLLSEKVSEYHTGYRAFSKEVLETLPLLENSDDFVFDNQVLAQTVFFGFRIGEISCPTKYFTDASSINFRRSVIYGLGVLSTAAQFKMQKMGFRKYGIFDKNGRRLEPAVTRADAPPESSSTPVEEAPEPKKTKPRAGTKAKAISSAKSGATTRSRAKTKTAARSASKPATKAKTKSGTKGRAKASPKTKPDG